MEFNGQLLESFDVNIEYEDEDSVVDCPQPDQGSSWESTNVRASDLLLAVSVSADSNKAKITELAFSAMEELSKMSLQGESDLWLSRGDSETQTLNGLEYIKEFGSVDATLQEIMRMVEVGDTTTPCFPGFDSINAEFPFGLSEDQLGHHEQLHSEASRQIALVPMNSATILELLMNVKQWSLTFSNIISRATLVEVVSTGVGSRNYDGTMQVMSVELHLPTALVPTRESYFVRYCKQLNYGTWAVVDVSLESLFPCSPTLRFQRRPSGCLIQELPNGCSKVIWVEHVAADNRSVHSIYRPLVTSGYAYGAKRWVATIVRHCEWLATLRDGSTPTHDGVLIPEAGRESMLKLAERMTRSFWGDISASNGRMWMSLPITTGAEDIRVITRGVIQVPGQPSSTKIVFTTSLWLPVLPKRLFDFLRDHNSRIKWDIRLYGHSIRELAYVIIGANTENRISILQVNATLEEMEILYLQESFTDKTGSYVIYAPVDMLTMSRVLNGGNPDCVNILPCGFAILPDRPTWHGADGCGSLLTIAFHIVDKASTMHYIHPESVNTIYKVISETVVLIKTALISNNGE